MSQYVSVWTDGSTAGNPAPGGLAFFVDPGLGPDHRRALWGHTGGQVTTNQRMEMEAPILGLGYVYLVLGKSLDVVVYSDSAYVVNGMRQRWFDGWHKNGWLNSKKEPVSNRDLWLELEALDYAFAGHGGSVEFRKVKGHQKNDRLHARRNNLVDLLAKWARDRGIEKGGDPVPGGLVPENLGHRPLRAIQEAPGGGRWALPIPRVDHKASG